MSIEVEVEVFHLDMWSAPESILLMGWVGEKSARPEELLKADISRSLHARPPS
jgi:hypothetical protein